MANFLFYKLANDLQTDKIFVGFPHCALGGRQIYILDEVYGSSLPPNWSQFKNGQLVYYFDVTTKFFYVSTV